MIHAGRAKAVLCEQDARAKRILLKGMLLLASLQVFQNETGKKNLYINSTMFYKLINLTCNF